MSFLGNIFHTIFPISNMFTKDKPKTDPYQALLDQLNPLIQAQTKVTTQAGAAGLSDTGKSRSDLDYVSNWFKNILTGSDDSLLKMFDTSGLTKNIDENQQQLNESGVRGGARAATIGGASFNRDAAINKALQSLRFAAPDKIADIASRIGSLGLGELGAATGASAGASSNLFGIEQLKQADADRRTQLIGSIFEAIGAVTGAAVCVVADTTYVKTTNGEIIARDIELNDEIISGEKIRKVIRKRLAINEPIIRLFTKFNMIEVTHSHVFSEENSKEVIASEIMIGSLLNKREIIKIEYGIADVVIIKLDDEEANYPFITNNFVSLDDDCLVVKDDQYAK